MSGPVPMDSRMIDGRGRVVLAHDEQHAAWLTVEEGARPFDAVLWPWERVLTLSGPRTIDEKVYLPGSML